MSHVPSSVTLCNVTLRNTPRRPLTDLQQAILNIIWSKGPVTSEQVREALLPRHPLRDSTVRTLLRRLETRGYVTHRLEGKVFLFSAAVAHQRVAARTVQQVIDRFWGGSVQQFLTGLVDEKVLTIKEIERLARKTRKSK